MKRRSAGHAFTGCRLSIVVCALLAASTPAIRAKSAVECSDGAHVSLRAALAVVSPRAEPLTVSIRNELTAVWQGHGLALRWIDVGSVRSADDDVLRVMVQDEELPAADQKLRFTVGWIRFVDGRPQNIIRVSRQTALAYMTRMMVREAPLPMESVLDMTGVRDMFVRLLAWSLAHEIGHYVLATPGHTKTGLMRRGFVPEDLIDARERAVSLMPVESGRLTAWAAACRRADARPLR